MRGKISNSFSWLELLLTAEELAGPTPSIHTSTRAQCCLTATPKSKDTSKALHAYPVTLRTSAEGKHVRNLPQKVNTLQIQLNSEIMGRK